MHYLVAVRQGTSERIRRNIRGSKVRHLQLYPGPGTLQYLRPSVVPRYCLPRS